MGKINLNIDGSQLFGRYLPSVFINEISLDNNELSDGSDRPYDYKFMVDLRINFTKEGEMEDPQSYMEENFDKLYLYCWMSGFETLNTELQIKQLHLKDLFSAFTPEDIHTLTSSDSAFPYIIQFMKDAFVNKDKIDYFGESGTEYRAIYWDTSKSDLEAGIEDPNSIWYELFWGKYGKSGPWDREDLNETVTGYLTLDGDIETWNTSADIGFGKNYSYMRSYIQSTIYFLQAAHAMDTHDINQLSHKIKLTDLLSDESGYGATLVSPQQFDSQGKEIVQIANIIIPFIYEYNIEHVDSFGDMMATYLDMKTRLGDVEKLFFIAVVGVDDHEIGVESTPRTLFNNYFGDISYEHVLQNNEVPNQLVEKFVEMEDGGPYNGIPFQGVDGKYYVSEPVAHDSIVETFQKLASKYASMAATRSANRAAAGMEYDRQTSQLETNIQNLEYILSAHGESTLLLRELQSYLQTYPNRSTASKSGELYNEVAAYLYAAAQTISIQRQVKKELIRTGIITDYRRPVDVSLSYVAPTPLGTPGQLDPPFEKGTGDVPSDDYIPTKWSQMSRKAKPRWVDSYFTGFGAEYDTVKDQIEDDFMAHWGDEWEDAGWSSMYDLPEFIEFYTDLWFDERKEAGSDLFRTSEDQRQTADFVVRNNGYFFFEWEKALRTQSALSHVVNLARLQRYLRIAIPYQYFKVDKIMMKRKELHLAPPDSTKYYAGAEGDWGTGVVQTAWMDSSKNYPATIYSSYWVEDGVWGYGYPFIWQSLENQPEDAVGDHVADLKGNVHHSYLKFVNFDTATDMTLGGGVFATDTLSYYGFIYHSMTDAETGVVGTDYARPLGYGVRDGYRLMCFEYADYMDDDVAYYNTLDFDGRCAPGGPVQDASFLNEPCTDYRIQVDVTDRTPQFYVDFIIPIFKDAFAEFEEYYNAAYEWCSYNNLNNQFNEFFVDAMAVKYPTDFDPPWFKCALLYTLFEQIFFNTYGVMTDGEEVEETIMLYAAKLARTLTPKKGNLRTLKEFKCKFERVVLYQLYPGYTSDTPPACEDYSTHYPQIWNRLVSEDVMDLSYESDLPLGELFAEVHAWDRALSFVNRIPIKEPIYGNFLLDTLETPDTSAYVPHETPPPGTVYITVGNRSNNYVASSWSAAGATTSSEWGPTVKVLRVSGTDAGTWFSIDDASMPSTDSPRSGDSSAPVLIHIDRLGDKYKFEQTQFWAGGSSGSGGTYVLIKVRYGPSKNEDTRIFAINLNDTDVYKWYNVVGDDREYPDIDRIRRAGDVYDDDLAGFQTAGSAGGKVYADSVRKYPTTPFMHGPGNDVQESVVSADRNVQRDAKERSSADAALYEYSGPVERYDSFYDWGNEGGPQPWWAYLIYELSFERGGPLD